MSYAPDCETCQDGGVVQDRWDPKLGWSYDLCPSCGDKEQKLCDAVDVAPYAAIVLRCIEGYALDKPDRIVSVVCNEQKDGKATRLCLAYFAGIPPAPKDPNEKKEREEVALALDWQGEVAYLVWIRVDDRFRGQGHGEALYRIAERICKELGASEIRMTASGETHLGEYRGDYAVRKLGYTQLRTHTGMSYFKRL